jgi:hypothetical protein
MMGEIVTGAGVPVVRVPVVRAMIVSVVVVSAVIVMVMARLIVTIVVAIMVVGVTLVRPMVVVPPLAIDMPVFIAAVIHLRAPLFKAWRVKRLRPELPHAAEFAHASAKVSAAKSTEMTEAPTEVAAAASPGIRRGAKCCY